MEVSRAIESCGNAALQGIYRTALNCVRRTLELYGTSGVGLSFNGGKDSTVLLHIVRAAVASLERAGNQLDSGSQPDTFHTFVFERQDDFKEIDDFVEDTNRQYSLGMRRLNIDFRNGVKSLVSETSMKAIILGTRRGDPNAEGQDTFCPSDKEYPPFMRVNPILEWGYGDVWAFLRTTAVPYCSMYDQGYTSVGNVHNTHPNSSLRKEDGTYAPAYMLADGRLERAGRTSKSSTGLTSRVSLEASLTRTAIIVVVGDEILTGKVEDCNSSLLCRELHALGWRVLRVAVVPDEVGAVAAEVQAASAACEMVITSGGVGPTLDDVTMAAVARAMGYPLARNHDMESRIRAYFGDKVTPAHLKMADTPAGEVELIDYSQPDGSPSPFPLLQCRNIYVLPGVPHLLERKWQVIKERLQQRGGLQPFHNTVLRLSCTDETSVVPAMSRVASGFLNKVTLGSYPVSRQPDGAGILISLESKDPAQLEDALSLLQQQLPAGIVAAVQHDTSSLALDAKAAESP